MMSIPTAWRRRLPLALAAVLFAVGNLVFFVSYRANTHERREALEARRNDLQRAVEAREAEATRLAAQRQRLSVVSEAMEEFYGRRIGTQQQTLSAVVADLHASLKDAGIEANQISYATVEEKQLPLTQLRITFAIKTDYPRFKKLLRNFESGKRWLAVQSIAIHREGDEPGAVGVQLELVTYFSDPDEVPAPGPPAGPAASARGAVPARSS